MLGGIIAGIALSAFALYLAKRAKFLKIEFGDFRTENTGSDGFENENSTDSKNQK